VAFGADPTSSATISFASNTSAAAYVSVSPGVGRVPAPGYDNTFANSAGLAVVYRAPLAGLLPSTTYTYTCTVGGATSAPRTFTTLSADPAAVPIVMYWGDLGRDGGGQAFPALEAEAARTARREPGAASVAIQAGDFAYDLGDLNGARGAAFMERFSNISAFLPTYTLIGNHELPPDLKHDVNASHYVNMLGAAMPGGTNGSYYSVNVGLNHIIVLSSEVLALGPYGGVTAEAQAAWLEADLAAVSRARTPWVVATFHRPFYCSNANSWCGPGAWQANPVRLAFEPLFMKYGVDVVLTAHEHSVELLWPVNAGRAVQFDYNSPAAPVHVIAGAAGCNEEKGECLNPMGAAAGDWSRARLAGDPQQYGFSRFWASNATHWHLEQVQTNLPGGPQVWGEVVDIVQLRHGPFSLGALRL
jgi:hypothetical protein